MVVPVILVALLITTNLCLGIIAYALREVWRKNLKLEQALLRSENPYAANAQMTVDRQPRPAPPPAKKVIGR